MNARMKFILVFFVLGCGSAPLNRFQFQEEISTEIRDKLNGLDLNLALSELDLYRMTQQAENAHGFRDRMMIDGFLGMFDPGNNVPGSRSLGKHLSTLLEVLQLGQVAYEVEHSVFGGASCTACKAGLMFLSYYIQSGAKMDQLIKDANKMCTTFRMVPPRMCQGLVNSYGPELYPVLKNLSQSPEEMCGFMFGEACNNPYNPIHEWDILLPPVAKPPPLNQVFTHEKTFKILHLSDTHFDPFYEEGSNANCGEPLCCRTTSGAVAKQEDGAGYWGDYRKCDSPLRAIESMYGHIVRAHPEIHIVYWTGDLPAHDIWNQTKLGNLEILQETAHQLRKHFPGKLVLPALGNHESAPVDSFPPPFVAGEHSISWLYSTLVKEWTGWIGTGHSPTIRYGGYFSAIIAPGLRLISLNMNYCMNKNFWLLLNSTDPAEELKWLVYELQLAEFKGEKVHLIGHIPPGHVDCVAVWSRNFNKIINRYEHTVTAQFYGHTHYDEFEIFYDMTNRKRPLGIAYIAPSVTPYYGLNPRYRLYEVSAMDGKIVDHETWYMDLQKANANPGIEPVWEKLYSAKEDLRLASLSPSSWSDYVELIEESEVEFSKFYNYFHGGSLVRPECDLICKRKIICNLRSSQSHVSKESCKDPSETWSFFKFFNIFRWFG